MVDVTPVIVISALLAKLPFFIVRVVPLREDILVSLGCGNCALAALILNTAADPA